MPDEYTNPSKFGGLADDKVKKRHKRSGSKQSDSLECADSPTISPGKRRIPTGKMNSDRN